LKYELFIEREAQEQLAPIQEPHQYRIIAAIEKLSDEPGPPGSKKLGGRNAWRIHVGEYTVIYEIQDEAPVILVVAIGHRREIFRR